VRRADHEDAPIMTYVWVALGSAVGGVARYGSAVLFARLGPALFPWSTLAVNVSGSLLIGVLAGLSLADGRALIGGDARALLMVGLCGGFTTFSSFSLETLRLAREGAWVWAGANVMFSVLLCLGAVWLGTLLGAALSR
jgi:CrcB protein